MPCHHNAKYLDLVLSTWEMIKCCWNQIHLIFYLFIIFSSSSELAAIIQLMPSCCWVIQPRHWSHQGHLAVRVDSLRKQNPRTEIETYNDEICNTVFKPLHFWSAISFMLTKQKHIQESKGCLSISMRIIVLKRLHERVLGATLQTHFHQNYWTPRSQNNLDYPPTL